MIITSFKRWFSKEKNRVIYEVESDEAFSGWTLGRVEDAILSAVADRYVRSHWGEIVESVRGYDFGKAIGERVSNRIYQKCFESGMPKGFTLKKGFTPVCPEPRNEDLI